jgi:hypothetical protein
MLLLFSVAPASAAVFRLAAHYDVEGVADSAVLLVLLLLLLLLVFADYALMLLLLLLLPLQARCPL